MSSASLVTPLLNEAATLSTRLADFDLNPQLAVIARKLRDASDLPASPPNRPLLVALIGGTGVGKSELFNALLGEKEKSPTSAGIRLKTTRPFIACHSSEPNLLFDEAADYTHWDHPGIALVDTPDIDGVKTDHHAATERIISQSDVIVFVTSPDKSANFDPIEVVRRWASPKRWLFVFNKCDLLKSKVRAMEDWDHRLREQKFAPDESCRFAICAAKPGEYDFPRFRDAILTERPGNARTMLAEDAALGRLLHACDRENLGHLESLAQKLRNHIETLTEGVISDVKKAITDADLIKAAAPMLRARIWAALPARIGGLAALPVLARARLSAFGAAFRGWRLATSGFSLWRFFAFARSLQRAWLGGMETALLLDPVEKELEAKLGNLNKSVRRVMEENHLPVSATPASEPTWSEEISGLGNEQWFAMRPFFKLASWAVRKMEQSPVTRELSPLVTEAIEARAIKAAEECTPRWRFLLQLPPLCVIGHAGYLLVQGWMSYHWYPGAFYLHAFALLLLSLIPGYLITSLLVTRALSRRNLLERLIANEADKLPPVGALRGMDKTAGELLSLYEAIKKLRQRVTNQRNSIQQDLGFHGFGVTAKEAASEACTSSTRAK